MDSAAAANLHLLKSADFNLTGISKKEVVRLYDGRMAKRRSAGRHIYDELMLLPANGLCPLCGHRDVSTLDHHLPKTAFFALAVTPLNLIAVCMECNKVKGNRVASTADEQTMHPYFDDIERQPWLYAEVIETLPVAVRFYVRCPDSWGEVLKRRTESHFKRFKLARLYAVQAAQELQNIRYQVDALRRKGSASRVHRFLQECAESRRKVHLNSWQTAMYSALESSTWFQAGGYLI
ncbi:HNH endonuclease [Fodinicola acaciae]|uniref:HNH endonuclease n=1 Tax=Fodinicola acaciae TaxID=2681555 RepID=UPI0013D48443|nr:HNH endonuclease [Fodinicola acaciae]